MLSGLRSGLSLLAQSLFTETFKVFSTLVKQSHIEVSGKTSNRVWVCGEGFIVASWHKHTHHVKQNHFSSTITLTSRKVIFFSSWNMQWNNGKKYWIYFNLTFFRSAFITIFAIQMSFKSSRLQSPLQAVLFLLWHVKVEQINCETIATRKERKERFRDIFCEILHSICSLLYKSTIFLLKAFMEQSFST